MDLQVFAAPRVTLKPLVPTFPCFASIVVSLLEKVSKEHNISLFLFVLFNLDCTDKMIFSIHLQPHVDFGIKILGGDIMSIPGLYRFVQVLHQ